MSFLLSCQKLILIMTNAIPTGRKTPIFLLITLIIMNINPLIEKSIAAVLYDFEFLDGLLFTMKEYILFRSHIEFIPYAFGSQ